MNQWKISNMLLYSYKQASESGKVLAEGLGIKRIKHEGSSLRGSADKVVINWGASEVPEQVGRCTILNKPELVANASNKLKFFNTLEGRVSMPEHTDNIELARLWSEAGFVVVERHKLTGNSGEGIRLVEKNCPQDITQAPLYVKYIPKKQEYRVHVANGQVVDLQRKARRHDVADEDINWRVRNHDNGFIFQRNDLEVPHDVSYYAVESCKLLGLDFGAVDVIYNERQERAYVLEVNTAPGLTGQTLEGYVERFKNWDFDNISGGYYGRPVEDLRQRVRARDDGIDWEEARRIMAGGGVNAAEAMQAARINIPQPVFHVDNDNE